MSKKLICVDGNTAAAYIGYAFSELTCIYPITPSTPMAEYCDEAASKGVKNIFGSVGSVVELQSEAGAVGAVHGGLVSGAMTTTYTASQGLLLMIPTMYKIAGEMLPCVFHIASRTIAGHALNIFGDHSDVMACRQTGFCILASNSVQEAMDMALVAHIATYRASLPFIHFFDGFRTSHEINKIEEISYETIKQLIPQDEIKKFKSRAHNPEHPKITGTAQNPDIFFQNKESANVYYNHVYDIVKNTMDLVGEKTGRNYQPFEYYGDKNAENIIVSMCSSCEIISETIDELRKSGKRVGLIKVRLYRPFNTKAFVEEIPKSVKYISVLDKTKEPGSVGEPLFQDVVSALNEHKINIIVNGGRYGLGGKDILPANIASVFENAQSENPLREFTVGINDDQTNLSLPEPKNFTEIDDKYYECKFFGLGSDGTVSANKSSIKIIGENTNKYIQGYFEYDSKKSGGLTISHLRTSNEKIRSSYLVTKADFIAIHNFSYVNNYDVLLNLKKNGSVLLNTDFSEEDLGKYLPDLFKKRLQESNAKLYCIPALEVANKAGLSGKINVIMQSCFFKITGVVEFAIAEKKMKEFVIKSYGKKGEKVIESNMKAIDAATTDLKEYNVQKICETSSLVSKVERTMSEYYRKWVLPIETRNGNEMSVSEFMADGSTPTGTSQYEKRGIGTQGPKWIPENCIQCGQCTLVCPHAAIRSVLVKKEELADANESFKTRPALGAQGLEFRIQVSPLDCTGCSSCANTCPAKNKALVMTDTRELREKEIANWEYFQTLTPAVNPYNKTSIKGVQFEKPYFEFSGACAGCGETPYIKLVTQMYGDQMVVANATGCSSIYGASEPTTPYCVDSKGQGPSWGNSLFENDAEYGYGMRLAFNYRRHETLELLKSIASMNVSQSLKDAIKKVIETTDTKQSKIESDNLASVLQNEIKSNNEPGAELLKALSQKDMFAKKSIWLFGGDGWAYDIGFGGIDHLIASGENVNILVMDTEVYSNTGGQSSKATPAGSVVKFASTGKTTRKKDLGLMMMTYKDVYIAQVSMGADQGQLIRAIREAESYNGPSLIIAYAPCINHGIDMSNVQAEMKKAVATGYWSLYRHDPRNIENPLTIDSKDPTLEYSEFLSGEGRYSALAKRMPEQAKKLFAESAKQAKERLDSLKKLASK